MPPSTSGFSGLGMASGAIGPIISGVFGLGATALQYKYNKQLADQQNQYNIDMWKMQADYNSPQNQMRRFEEAGLNPNLIYGQGSNGNMSSPPQMVTPQAPDYSDAFSKLAEAFNVEKLRTIVAERKRAQADADNARTNADRNRFQLRAERNIGLNWDYDYKAGKYVLRPTNEVNVIDPSAYYANRILEQNYNQAHLIPYRQALYLAQRNYLLPQIEMAKYDAKNYKYNYWIGQGSKVAGAISNFLPNLIPFKFGGKFGTKGFVAPNGRYYNF